MAKRAFVIGLVIVAVLIGVSQFVSAQEAHPSLLSLNRTGVENSLLTIGMTGINSSRLSINTTIIEITLTGVHMYPINCNFGLLRPGDIRLTETAFTILNASNATIDVAIYVDGDWIGGVSWTHSDECAPGVNTAGLRAIVEDGDEHTSIIVRKTEPFNDIVSGLAPGDECHFALEIYAPTSFTDNSPKSNNILIEASEAT